MRLKPIGKQIIHFEAIQSTQDVAIAEARQGKEEGIVFWADEQKKGRGRWGRSWFSLPSKCLLFSFILRPKTPAKFISYLSLFPALACSFAIERYGVRCLLKWPNDILIEGKKAGGILVETEVVGDRIEWAVVGIGINVNLVEEEFPAELRATATSLRIVLGKMLDIEGLLKDILRELNEWYEICFSEEGREKIREEWEKRDFLRGKEIEVGFANGGKLKGIADGIDEMGYLRVRVGEGKIVLVSTGEVYLLEKI
ncbi:MAG: biotin--[acetyl-CoA-carboxylase] ligase [bacterium]